MNYSPRLICQKTGSLFSNITNFPHSPSLLMRKTSDKSPLKDILQIPDQHSLQWSRSSKPRKLRVKVRAEGKI